MTTEQFLMGATTVALCLFGLWHADWLLQHTRKGRRLVARFGDVSASRILRLLLLAGAIFGGLLAAGIVNPIRWSSPPSEVQPS